MKNTKKRILKSLVVLLVAILIAFGTTVFVCEAAVYTVKHFTVVIAESDGETPTYTADGKQTWLPSQVEAYNNVKAERAELVAKSDIAKFLFDCGGSYTGKVVRIILCIQIILCDGVAIWYGYYAAKSIFKGTRRLIRWKIRENNMSKRIQEKSSKMKENNVRCGV